VTAPKDGFLGTLAYGMSKPANVLSTEALRERLLGEYGIKSFAVDPGGNVRPSLDFVDPVW
jgi:NAD(P)-dependent dehydrogenase (short-subunit alcohol dehydrogenase family)